LPEASPSLPRLPTEIGAPSRAERDAIGQVVKAWNNHVPRNHVRRITRQRVLDVQAALREFSAEEIVEAIRFYASRDWQRRNQAGRTFDRWIAPQCVLAWWEAAREARELRAKAERRAAAFREAAAPRHAARAPSGGGAGNCETYAQRRRRFDALPEPRRNELLAAAGKAMLAMGVQGRRITASATIAKALELMVQQECTGKETPHG